MVAKKAFKFKYGISMREKDIKEVESIWVPQLKEAQTIKKS